MILHLIKPAFVSVWFLLMAGSIYGIVQARTTGRIITICLLWFAAATFLWRFK